LNSPVPDDFQKLLQALQNDARAAAQLERSR
jgi:hypothetical protein